MDQHQHAGSAERASWFSDFDGKNKAANQLFGVFFVFIL